MRLYAVTDRAWVGKMSLMEQVEAALKNGVTCLQLREKTLDDDAFLREAKEMAALCHRYAVPFIVNDNVQIAIACGADGVHVGQQDMAAAQVRQRIGASMILGVSVHTVSQALEAVQNGADYLGLGSVFATSTKLDADLMTLDTLKAICNTVCVPTVAIGGIHPGNLLQLKGSGVDGVAVVSAIFGAPDPGAAAAQLLALSEEMTRK